MIIRSSIAELLSLYDVVFLEGAGGLAVPLTEDFTLLDYLEVFVRYMTKHSFSGPVIDMLSLSIYKKTGKMPYFYKYFSLGKQS